MKTVAIAISTLLVLSSCAQLKRLNPFKKTCMKRYFKKADRNGDGKVSRGEWKRAYNKKFKKMDKNRDGYVTMKEMKMYKKMKRK